MSSDSYAAKLNADNAANLRRSRNVRDIAGDYPPPGKPERRAACERDFRRFCDVYFLDSFFFPWSADHLRVIDRIQSAVLDGGLFAVAMPRGSGKTTLCEKAALWALLYGHRRFVCLIGSTEAAAELLLEHLKRDLSYNPLLGADFRHVCYPLRRLENNARKCIGQLFDGQQTCITWEAKRLTFPTMPDYACDGKNVSGSTVTVAGITGALRGQSHTLTTGEVIRPEMVILDDPQTRESASSLSQCASRLSIITGDVLGMAGPGKKIAAIMPCTVIRDGDLADQLLDREKHPEWQGERTKAVYSWPKREDLWENYRKLRVECLKSTGNTSEATEYYAKNREAMDEGAVIAWPHRYYTNELSAVQHVMNLRYDLGDSAFFAEYQNEPISDDDDREETEPLSVDVLVKKLNGMKRGEVSIGANHLTMFIDVHSKLLYWVVVAWSDDFTGYVLDYGTYPEQKRRYFTLRDATRTLALASPGAGLEGSIYAGLEALTNSILVREWKRDDGAMMKIERCLIDANWGEVTDLIYQFCRQSAHSVILTPSHGKFIGAGSTPLSEYRRKPGDRVGLNWRIPNVQGRRAVRYVVFDANYWKSFVHSRLRVQMGDHGCLSLFGRNSEAHQLFAEHLTSEYCVKTQGRNRIVDEWKLRASGQDNHWFDCLVGCAVGASIQGVSLLGDSAKRWTASRKKVKLSDIRREKR